MSQQDFEDIRAFIFDMDGVITNTAEAHFTCWKEVFDDFLRKRSGEDEEFRPFTREDYLEHVDGIPRYDGVRRFLESRGIDLPEGSESDKDEHSVHGLGNLKNERFREWLNNNQVPAFEDARALLESLRHNDMKLGVFSSSRNAKQVLDSARVRNLFDAEVDGAVAAERGLEPKPDPAILVETARRLGSEPGNAIVVEDAVLGVEAGARGHFSLVVGINRQDKEAATQRHALRAHGADIVVQDLRRLLMPDGSGPRTLGRLASVWDLQRELDERIGSRPLAVFLDYDGTLTPIVSDYRKADISPEMVEALRRLAARYPTAIISGRDLDDVRSRVGVEDIFYAGSHGFDIAGPGGLHERPGEAEQFLKPLDDAGKSLKKPIEEVEGAEIERKTFSIAVHFRNVAQKDVSRVEQAVDRAIADHGELRKGRGKKVFEIQPRADWDKGRAIDWLLGNTRLGENDALPLYIGDDITDEDAFAALSGSGISIAVRGADRITTADYALEDPQDVCRFIDWLSTREKEAAR